MARKSLGKAVEETVESVKGKLAPTAVALGLMSESEESEAAYIPLKAFAEGSEAAQALFKKAQKRIAEGADTRPNGELYNEMGVYRSEDGDFKVDVAELRARDVEKMQGLQQFAEDIDFYLSTNIRRKKKLEYPITRYLPEDSPIFENFPELKEVKVSIRPQPKNSNYLGEYNPNTKEVIVYADNDPRIDYSEFEEERANKILNSFNTLFHEFQHYIQDVKKAANTGYNTVASLVATRGFREDYKDAVDALKTMQPGDIGYDQFKNKVDSVFGMVQKSLSAKPKSKDAPSPRDEFLASDFDEKLKTVEDVFNTFEKGSTDTDELIQSSQLGHNIYIRELGEAEARSTGLKALIPEGSDRKAIGVFYPTSDGKQTALRSEDVSLYNQLDPSHVLVRGVPAYEDFTGMGKLYFPESVMGQEALDPEIVKQAKKRSGDGGKGTAAVVAGGTAAGLASPPSEAFVEGIGESTGLFEDGSPTPSLFDVEGVSDELGITNTFLLDLLIPRTKPYDLISNIPGVGETMMTTDVIDSIFGDYLRGEGTEAGQRIRAEANQEQTVTDMRQGGGIETEAGLEMEEKQNVPAWLERALDPTTPTTEAKETVRTANNYFEDLGAEIIYPTIRMGEDGKLYRPEDPMEEAIRRGDYIVVEGPPVKETAEKAMEISKRISSAINESRTPIDATDKRILSAEERLFSEKVSFAEGGIMMRQGGGIETEAGLEMEEENPNKPIPNKADINKDGEIEGWEKARHEAIQKTEEKTQMAVGGSVMGMMADPFAPLQVTMDIDEESGNEVPAGSKEEEVRDDIPAMLSEGEYVVPADVVRYHGLKTFEGLRCEAKHALGLMAMHDRISYVDDDTKEPVDYDIEEKDLPKVEKAEVEVVEAADGTDVQPATDPTTFYQLQYKTDPVTGQVRIVYVDPMTGQEVREEEYEQERASRFAPQTVLQREGLASQEEEVEEAVEEAEEEAQKPCPPGFVRSPSTGACVPVDEGEGRDEEGPDPRGYGMSEEGYTLEDGTVVRSTDAIYSRMDPNFSKYTETPDLGVVGALIPGAQGFATIANRVGKEAAKYKLSETIRSGEYLGITPSTPDYGDWRNNMSGNLAASVAESEFEARDLVSSSNPLSKVEGSSFQDLGEAEIVSRYGWGSNQHLTYVDDGTIPEDIREDYNADTVERYNTGLNTQQTSMLAEQDEGLFDDSDDEKDDNTGPDSSGPSDGPSASDVGGEDDNTSGSFAKGGMPTRKVKPRVAMMNYKGNK